jgi:predicted ATPase
MLERAIEIARKQSAKSFELRAATSLARLLAQQSRHDEARWSLKFTIGSPKASTPLTSKMPRRCSTR